MTKRQQIAELKAKSDAIMKKYAREYEALADRSERLFDEREALEKDYEILNAKTGLSTLFEKIAKLKGNK